MNKKHQHRIRCHIIRVLMGQRKQWHGLPMWMNRRLIRVIIRRKAFWIYTERILPT